MFTSVLVPVAFAEEDSLILSFVRGLPALGVKRVVLGNVLDSMGMEGPIIRAANQRIVAALEALATQLADTELEVEVEGWCGDPMHDLVTLAAKKQCDALVMGSHAKPPADEIVEGSISETMINHAEVPTLVARYDLLREGAPDAISASFGRRLLLATDFSHAAWRALEFVTSLAPGAVETLRLVHVLDESESGAGEAGRETAAAFLDPLTATARERGIAAESEVLLGDPTTVVLEEIERWDATGVAVGTHGRNALQEALLGSLPMTLLRRASCPALIVPRAAEDRG